MSTTTYWYGHLRVHRLYWRLKSPTNQPWSCMRTWVLSETNGCSDTTWTEWTRCGSNCGSARGKKRGRGGRDSRCCSPRTLSAWQPQLCPGHFTLIYTYTYAHTQYTHRSMHVGMHRHANTPSLCPWPLNNCCLGRNRLTSHLMFSMKGPLIPSVTRKGRVRVVSGMTLTGGLGDLFDLQARMPHWPGHEVWGSSSEDVRLKLQRTWHHTKSFRTQDKHRFKENNTTRNQKAGL